MSEEQAIAQNCHDFVIDIARKEGKYILKITWDKEGGYPEHAWGHVQWTVRPYILGYGCDGTTDMNIHFIAKELCSQIELDYIQLHEQVYAEHDNLPDSERREHYWMRLWTEEQWAEIAKETIVPELSKENLEQLLLDLRDINNRSISYLLEDIFSEKGYISPLDLSLRYFRY